MVSFDGQRPPESGFSLDRSDGAECRRLRLALGLNAERMALVAGLPGRWAWLSIENGYEAIDAARWARCVAEFDQRPSGSGLRCPAARYATDTAGRRSDCCRG